MRAADWERLVYRVHDAMLAGIWRGDEILHTLSDPAALARETGLSPEDLDQWDVARTYWADLVAVYDHLMGDGAHLHATEGDHHV